MCGVTKYVLEYFFTTLATFKCHVKHFSANLRFFLAIVKTFYVSNWQQFADF